MNVRRTRRFAFFSLALASAAAAWTGCTATATNNAFTSSGGGGGSGGAAQSSSTSSGSGGGEISFDAGQNDANQQLEDSGVCTGTSAQAALIPLDMIILLDRSGSMSGTKWDGATAALKNFIGDTASAGIGVGLVYFPNDNADDCVYMDYANLDVAVGVLPGNAPALVTSIDGHSANGGLTPTHGALKGVLYAATSYQDANPTHKVVVVIATDGDPTSCAETSATAIANLAKSAHNYNGVETYVIAVQGSTLANLNQLAVAGGTTKAYDVTSDVTLFAAKMAEIRSKALACEVAIPPPPMNQQLDPAKVNVNYTPGGQTTPTPLPNVLTAAQCGNSAAWYYDDNADPKKIMLCPAACQTVQADPTASISVVFGCKTVAM